MSDPTQHNLTKNIMSLIKKGQLKMKPRWYFVLSSLTMIGGFLGLIILTIFLVNLMSFSLRTNQFIHGTHWLSHFPWWALAVAIGGLGLSLWLFKKQDFSYKKSFLTIVFSLLTAVILTGWLMDYTGLDNLWRHRGMMRRLYQHYEGQYSRPSFRWPKSNCQNHSLDSPCQRKMD